MPYSAFAAGKLNMMFDDCDVPFVSVENKVRCLGLPSTSFRAFAFVIELQKSDLIRWCMEIHELCLLLPTSWVVLAIGMVAGLKFF